MKFRGVHLLFGDPTADLASTLITASEVYAHANMPAVTATSGALSVTANSNCYFRTVLDAARQGEFLAFYSKEILKQSPTIVITDEYDPYSKDSAEGF